MENNSTVVGLDVHKETITIAVLRPDKDRPDPSITVENQPSIIEKKVRELHRRHAPLEFVYEAGPGGFALYRQITRLGYPCAVIAPAWMPMKPGDRVKTDRKDAEKLSWYWRRGSGSVWTSPELMDTPEKGNTMYQGVSSDNSKRSEAVQ